MTKGGSVRLSRFDTESREPVYRQSVEVENILNPWDGVAVIVERKVAELLWTALGNVLAGREDTGEVDDE